VPPQNYISIFFLNLTQFAVDKRNSLFYIVIFSFLTSFHFQQMAEHVWKEMKEHGTKFRLGCYPQKIEKSSGKFKVTWRGPDAKTGGSDVFDTVLMATGVLFSFKYCYWLAAEWVWFSEG